MAVPEEVEEAAPVINLMDALRRSVAQAAGRPVSLGAQGALGEAGPSRLAPPSG